MTFEANIPVPERGDFRHNLDKLIKAEPPKLRKKALPESSQYGRLHALEEGVA